MNSTFSRSHFEPAWDTLAFTSAGVEAPLRRRVAKSPGCYDFKLRLYGYAFMRCEFHKQLSEIEEPPNDLLKTKGKTKKDVKSEGTSQ
jgi:hypothetical protein